MTCKICERNLCRGCDKKNAPSGDCHGCSTPEPTIGFLSPDGNGEVRDIKDAPFNGSTVWKREDAINAAVRDITAVGVCPAPKSAVKKILERLLAEAEAQHKERMERVREGIEKSIAVSNLDGAGVAWVPRERVRIALAAFDDATLKGEGERITN